jgi:hypothetical protein
MRRIFLGVSLLILASGCDPRSFFASQPSIDLSHAAAKSGTPPNNLSIQTGSEIQLKLLALMPNATIKLNDGNNYDVFSYQENPYSYRFGLLNGLGIAASQPGGPNITFPDTTQTHVSYAGPSSGTFSNNGPLDLSALPNFTIPKFFYPVRQFSVAFSSKYASVLASLVGNPTPISNIGFRSMTAELCAPGNLKVSPMFNPANAWIQGAPSADPIYMHIHAMATQAWLVPHTANSGEIKILRTGYDALKTQGITDGLNDSDASDSAYLGICQAIFLSPQFWIGPSGKSQALIRATTRVAGRLPTQTEMNSYLNSSAGISPIITRLMQESGFTSTVEGWHMSQLGIQMAAGGSFGGQAFRSVNWAHSGAAIRAVVKSAWIDPITGSPKSVWIGSPLQWQHDLTVENLQHLSYYSDWFLGGAFSMNTNAGAIALGNYLSASTTLNNGGGQRRIINQPFDNRTTGLWFRRFNTITHQMELLGGFMLNLGNDSDNGIELLTQTGFTDVTTRCTSWAYHPTRWLICKGSVTIDNSGTKQNVDLSHIPLDVPALEPNVLGGVVGGDGNPYTGFAFTTSASGSVWPAAGLGSDYSNLPLYGQNLAERWSPSGLQNGFSQIYLPQSHDTAWVSNTFSRFDVSCVRKNTVHSNPAPDFMTATAPIDPYYTGAGCGTMSPSATTSMADAFGSPTGCSNGFYRLSYGYKDTAWGLHMDPRVLESYHCGAVNTATLTQNTGAPATMSQAINGNLWSDDTYDSIVPFGPYAFNDRNPAVPNQNGYINIAWNLTTSSDHTYNFPDMTTGTNYTSLESAMNSSPYLQAQHAQQKMIEAEAMMEPARLLEAILDKRDGLGDYRQLITSPITYGSNFYQHYLLTSGNTLPYWPAGFTPKFGLDRFAVNKIDRTLFRPVDLQVLNLNPFLGGRQSVYLPGPANTGILTMASFTRPVSENGGKMRTMANRILSRLLPGPDAFVPTNPDLHKQYFLTVGGAADPHLQPACISCHINLDPMVRALYPSSLDTSQPLFDPVLHQVHDQTLAGSGGQTWEVGGEGSNFSTGHQSTGVVLDQRVTGWEQVAQVIANHPLFALNTVTQAYNNLYHPVGVPSLEHTLMINQVTQNFMSHGYDYRAMILDLMTYGGYFEAIP